jgi:hypothetical protein
MRLSILAILIACTATARADLTFQTHEEFGVDFAMMYGPRTNDEVDAGAMFHFVSGSSRMPSWVTLGSEIGMLTGSEDRIVAPLFFNLRFGDREGPFAQLDLGWLVTSPISSDEGDFTWSLSGGAGVGWKLGPWRLSASALKSESGVFTGPMYMFALGRDLVYFDSVVTRSSP